MKKCNITLRAYSGVPLATTTGYAYDVGGVALVVHPAHIFSAYYSLAGAPPALNKPKGLWQVSEPVSGSTISGDGVTFNSRQKAIDAAQKRISAFGGAESVRQAVAKALERYARVLV